MSKKSWIVVGVGPLGNLAPAPNPMQHSTEVDAVREAERLARLNPGKEFRVFEAITSSRTISTVTSRL